MNKIVNFFILFFLLGVTIYVFSSDNSSKKNANENYSAYLSNSSVNNKSSNIIDNLSKNFLPNSQSKINLTGPLMCEYQNNNISYEAFILNKNIRMNILNNNVEKTFLVKDDNLYSFTKKDKKYTDTVKTMGVKDLLYTIESFAGFLPEGSVDNFIFSFLPVTSQDANFKDVFLKSCIEKTIDEAVFTVPGNLIFKEVSLEEFGKLGLVKP